MIIMGESNRVTTLVAQALGNEYEDLKGMFDYFFYSFRIQEQ